MNKKHPEFEFSDSPEVNLTAKDKARIAREWNSFLEQNLDYVKFTKTLYQALHLHFGYIALRERSGFYEYYFGKGRQEFTLLFLRDFRGHLLEMQQYWSWEHVADLAGAMEAALDRHEARLTETLRQSQYDRDLRNLQVAADTLGYELVKREATG